MKWRFYPASDFAAQAKIWDELNAAGLHTPLLSSEFVLASLHAFGSGEEQLAVCGDPAHPDAMALLKSRSGLAWNTFQAAQNPIGCWLMRPGSKLEALLASLLHALPGMPLVLGVTQQDPWLMARPVDSQHVLSFDYIDTLHVELPGDFEHYWQSRGKNLRQNMRTVRNRLEKNGFSCRLHCITAAEQVEFAIEHFARMESSGWKGIAGTAVQFDSGQGRFYVELLQTLCRQGTGRIYYLTFNETIVAMDLCVCQHKTAIVLKTTYDEVYSAYSPAMMLHQKLLRELSQSGVDDRLEFYGKARDWQLRLTDRSRALYHVNYYRWAWLKTLMQRRIANRSGQ